MVTILGAGGAIGNELTKELIARNERIRLVSRNPKASTGDVETLAPIFRNSTILSRRFPVLRLRFWLPV